MLPTVACNLVSSPPHARTCACTHFTLSAVACFGHTVFRCDDLSLLGILAVILLMFFFWPLAWVPCVITECHRRSQRPVYGFPPTDQEYVPTLVPGAAVNFPHHQMMYFPNQQ